MYQGDIFKSKDYGEFSIADELAIQNLVEFCKLAGGAYLSIEERTTIIRAIKLHELAQAKRIIDRWMPKSPRSVSQNFEHQESQEPTHAPLDGIPKIEVESEEHQPGL